MESRVLLALVALSAGGCIIDGGFIGGIRGNGEPATLEWSIDTEVNEVVVANFLDTTIVQGDDTRVSITCDGNLLDNFDVRVEGNEITLRTDNGVSLNPQTLCTAEVELSDLTSLQTSASGDIFTDAPFEGLTYLASSASGDIDVATAGSRELEIQVSASGSVTVEDSLALSQVDLVIMASGDIRVDNIEADFVSAESSASGSLFVNGDAGELTVELSASGDYDGADLRVEDAEVRLTASGDADVFATGRVTGRLSSSGDLTVRGGADVDVTTSGSGDVIIR